MSDVVVVGGSGGAELSYGTLGALKARVAGTIGGQFNPVALRRAQDFIYEVIDELNLWDRYAFMRTVESDTALVLDARTFDFPTDLWIPMSVQLIETTTGNVRHRLERATWDTIQELFTREFASGTPQRWAIRNPYSERKVHIWPPADQNAVDTWQRRLTYYTRIPRPEGDDTPFAVPSPVESVVRVGASAKFAQEARPNQVAMWGALMRQYEMLKLQLSSLDERDQDILKTWVWGPTSEASPLDGLDEWWRI